MTVFTKESVNQKGNHTMKSNELPHIHHKSHGLHPHPVHPVHHHERRAMLCFSLDEKDREVLLTVFGDEDSAASAESIIQDAPPEVQILAIQALNLVEEAMQLHQHQPEQQILEELQEVPAFEASENRIRMSCPVLGEAAANQFRQIYGETGYGFCTVLGTAPYEIAVVARILAYLNEKAGAIYGHH